MAQALYAEPASRPGPLRAGLAAVVVILALGPLAASSRAQMFELPAPTGPLPIGTTTWHVQDSRPESFGAPGQSRGVIVHAWYPSVAQSSGLTAPYLREGLREAQVFGGMMKQPHGFDALNDVRTHAVIDAPPARSPQRVPVLMFNAGYLAIPSSYTALVEDLASRGYAVLHVVHPYEATAARLSDGRVVEMVDGNGVFLPGIQRVLDEWGVEGDTMTKVTATTDAGEQVKLLRGYLGGLQQTHAALRRWVDDTRLALDRLASLDPKSPAGQLRARLDLDRVGALGHSMGGVTSAQFCVDDRRCRAGLNLDGIPQYGTMIDQGMPRPFLMVYSARQGRLGASDAIYRKASKYIRVDVTETLHLDFSDMILWGGPLAGRPIFGTIAPTRAVEITRTIVREFFDQELMGRASALLTKKATMEGVKVYY